jgi:hypothetical protein
MPISGRYVNAEAGRGRPCRIWTAGDIATATLYWHSGRGDLSDPAVELFGEGKAEEIVVEFFGDRSFPEMRSGFGQCVVQDHRSDRWPARATEAAQTLCPLCAHTGSKPRQSVTYPGVLASCPIDCSVELRRIIRNKCLADNNKKCQAPQITLHAGEQLRVGSIGDAFGRASMCCF